MKNDKTNILENKKMNRDVYKLRREVMEYIYEIKSIVKDFPRIDVRITDNPSDDCLAVGRMGDKIIWVSEQCLTDSDIDLRTIVYHEVVHAVWAFGHDEKCPLMRSTHIPLTKEQCQKSLLKYAK